MIQYQRIQKMGLTPATKCLLCHKFKFVTERDIASFRITPPPEFFGQRELLFENTSPELMGILLNKRQLRIYLPRIQKTIEYMP